MISAREQARRDKISASLRGRKRSAATRKKISQTMRRRGTESLLFRAERMTDRILGRHGGQ